MIQYYLNSQKMTDKDILLLKEKGISNSTVEAQISRFKNGFDPLEILRPATLNDGILQLNTEQKETYTRIFSKEVDDNITLAKFVPASGAATRMFKDLYQYLEDPQPIKSLSPTHPVVKFIELLPRFAFFPLVYDQLKTYNLNNVHVRKARAVDIIKVLLNEPGLNYGFLPKGLVHFHLYENAIRTAMEEHLVEGSRFAAGHDDLVKVHFTISPEHETFFKNKLYQEGPFIENEFEIGLDVSFSFQKPHTDTLAVTPANEPFRDNEGQLLFRPGGHGALIENLNEQKAEIVFIKNIDNVVPQHLLATTIDYKKALGGLLLELRSRVFGYLEQLEEKATDELIQEIEQFIHTRLFATLPADFSSLDFNAKASYLSKYLNRPMRVCGMVRNEGEPGGGPFWVKEKSGQESLQILEGSQIDMEDKHQAAQLKAATHFNPVDLVCSTYNYKGEKFDLSQFTDPETGFISEKSYNGQPLKALELPGLWNGAMANWVTLFVEVPIETFNPVKSVNDLLRPQHQPVK
jgi:hypothetical protein